MGKEVAREFTSKGPQIKWDEDKQQVLIFVEIFGDQLRKQGIDPHKRITFPFLRVQWNSMQRSKNPVWHHVHVETKCQREEWSDVIRRIETAAKRLDFSLMMKKTQDGTNSDQSNLRKLNGRRRDRAPTTPEQRPNWPNDDIHGRQMPTPSTSGSSAQRQRQPQPEDEEPEQLSDWQSDDPRVRQMPGPSTRDSWAQTSPDKEPIPQIIVNINEIVLNINGCGKKCVCCSKEEVERDRSNGEEADILDDPHSHNKSSNGHPQEPTGSGQQEMGSEEPQPATGNSDLPGSTPIVSVNDLQFGDILGRCLPDQMPTVLFRWYNIDSQGINSEDLIRAGLFTGDDNFDLDVNHVRKHEILEMFESHVSKAKCPSPFISTFVHPLSPIHRAIRKQNEARLAMIDTSKLGPDAIVIKASTLVQLTNTRTRKWRGYGEYLIWEEVPRNAILCTFKISRLEDIAMDWLDIGEFLQLDVLRNTKFSDKHLYWELAKNLEMMPGNTLNEALLNMVKLLEVPNEFEETVAQRFKEAWMSMGRFSGTTEQGLGLQSSQQRHFGVADDSSEDGETYPFAETNDLGTNYEGLQHNQQQGDHFWTGAQAEPEIGYEPTHHGSVSSSDTSEESEHDADSEAVERCPRYDTSSPEFSTHDDEDDDYFPEERMVIERFSPGPSGEGRWVLSPFPINSDRDSNVA
ncbi:hypothetical protein N7540_007285 [Penicillium herquei]|nr:hypothetical protein N7540_007285 [Penicillium herquei]